MNAINNNAISYTYKPIAVQCRPDLIINDRKEQAISYFDERYSSRSGFIPFHSNNIENWLNKEYILEQPEHRVGALLDCLCSIEIDNENIIYWADSETGYINYTPKEIETADKLVRF